MAADSDGCNVTTIVTCEGSLTDPTFPQHLDRVVGDLEKLLGEQLIVCKLEPWNSVRVTLSIPHEAAVRLRHLASEGAQQLRALGILSVQVEGDQVISLRLAGPERQEIVLRTTQDGNNKEPLGMGQSSSNLSSGAVLEATSSSDEKIQFRSPNVVCPPDTVVPRVPSTNVGLNNAVLPTTRTYSGPFPFASMNQAIHGTSNFAAQPPPPPPYPGKHPPITISSPLLVNLLQNDAVSLKSTESSSFQNGADSSSSDKAAAAAAIKKSIPSSLGRTPNVFASSQSSSSLLAATNSHSSAESNVQTTRLQYNHQNVALQISSALEGATKSSRPVSKSVDVPTVDTDGTNAFSCPAYASSPTKTGDPLPQLSELTPSLTELKEADLDHLLPSLEHELAGSLPNLPEVLTDHRNYLINPLTGELEPHVPNDSDSDQPSDVFTGLPSPVDLSDDDTNSTFRPDTTDQSDSEGRSNHSDSNKTCRSKGSRGNRERGALSPSLKPTEKIKLRLKLEKSEPVSSAYKVDVSFINMPTAKKVSQSAMAAEELRVPPLHISLRGRNHVVINNSKKRNRVEGDLSKIKAKKAQDFLKTKKNGATGDEHVNVGSEQVEITENCSGSAGPIFPAEMRRVKKLKINHDQGLLSGGHLIERSIARHMFNSHNLKEKLKGRRGSDSDLTHTAKKNPGVDRAYVAGEKRRRSSHADVEPELTVLGSTNTGTVTGLPSQKPRKDKAKSKEFCKGKETNRNCKGFGRNLSDKLGMQVILPTGEIDMEAKFKQRLLENTESDFVMRQQQQQQQQLQQQVKTSEANGKVLEKSLSEEATKPAAPDGKSNELVEKQASRSPNSGGQGEDSGIESMDALSEKSPNQASQSPHADISETKPKTQVPELMDIEAQLAKMEGLNGEEVTHNGNAKLEQCCVLTSALQDSLKQGTVSITSHSVPILKEQLPEVEVSLVPMKAADNGEAHEPLPVRVTPPLYTYSNNEKGGGGGGGGDDDQGPDSPVLSDSDSNSCTILLKNKSLLEQLLIEIPADNQTSSSPSPITRQLRTRASSKLGSPELNSPVLPNKPGKVTAAASNFSSKRKRHESDSSNNSIDDVVRNKKPRKCSENAAELIKACMGLESNKSASKKGKIQDESSDSDEPLIEVAGKVRKTITTTATSNAQKSKFKSAGAVVGNLKIGTVNTRRSVRATPALNTRSKGEKMQPSVDVLRRKTRSSVSEGEGKRRKDVK